MVATSSRPPGVSVMRLASTSSTTLDRQALEQRDALAQRRLELDFAAHRAFGDGGDMRLEAGEIGQLVDAFLADHGGIHVGQQKLLAPAAPAGCTTMSIGRSPRASRRRATMARDVLAAGKGDVDRDFVEQPVRRPGRGKNGARAVDDRAIERGIGGIADQRGDERHAT